MTIGVSERYEGGSGRFRDPSVWPIILIPQITTPKYRKSIQYMAFQHMDYRPRIVDDELDLNMRTFGAVQIKGPKGCGKTTTAKQFAKTVIEFQDEDLRDR